MIFVISSPPSVVYRSPKEIHFLSLHFGQKI
jgi:hypothetical protein